MPTYLNFVQLVLERGEMELGGPVTQLRQLASHAFKCGFS